MGCACCCKKRQPLHSDTTITALLDETTVNVTKQINPQLHVTDEVKSDLTVTAKTPKLIPDIRQLQLIIFQSLHKNEYDFYPKYSRFSSVWNASSIEKEKCNICNNLLQVSLNIALYTNGANKAYIENMYNLLDYSIYLNHNMTLLPDLVQLIITFISGITFCDNIKLENKRQQLEFTYNKSIVTFKYIEDDYLNIRSNQQLVGDKILINCHVISKGDEMWVGLVNKKTYGITNEIEKKFGSLLYYGGREMSITNNLSFNKWDNGKGAIHAFGGVLRTVEYYRSGDWISFLIHTNENAPNCKIYKNGKKIFDIDALPFTTKRNKMNKIHTNQSENVKQQDIDDDNGIYFCVVVDYSMDSFIVEEVIYTQNVVNVT